MDNLYINNFRGFSKTYIPLKDVNFFVGENSTGKTSILSLIQLLGEHSFNFNADFGDTKIKDLNLNIYDEIASDTTLPFQVGGYMNKFTNKRSAFLLEFKKKDGVPKLSDIKILTPKYEMQFLIMKDKILYKISSIKNNLKKKPYDFFINWLSKVQRKANSFNEIKIPSNKFSYFLLGYFIKMEIESGLAIDKDIIDYLPQPINENLLEPSVWISPIRAKPERIYEPFRKEHSPDGKHIGFILNQYFSSKKKNIEFVRHLNDFGKRSGLYKSISIHKFNNYVDDSPFTIDVKLNKSFIKISNVGYGVSQILPIISDILSTNINRYIIQQPEIHLHPKAQAHLGEFFFIQSFFNKKKFFIETHSDFIIDKFRSSIRDNQDEKIQAQIIFFERKGENNFLHPINVEKNGDYSKNQPSTFRKFFIHHQIETLGL